MGLSIKNAEVEKLLREIAVQRGVGMTEALRQLLAEELERHRVAREAKVRAVREIARQIAAMPDVSNLTHDDILGYDENGVPSR